MKQQIKTISLRNLAIIGLLASATFSANESMDRPTLQKPNEISIRYSNLTGYGVGYQVNFLTHYYARTTAWFKYYEYIKGDPKAPIRMETNKNYNIGLDLQRNIIKEDKYRVFGLIAGGYAIREKIRKEQTDVLTHNPGDLEQQLITGGIGGGIEYFLLKNVSTDLGVSYKFDYDLKKNVHSIDAKTFKDRFDDESTKETGLGLSIGLNLNF